MTSGRVQGEVLWVLLFARWGLCGLILVFNVQSNLDLGNLEACSTQAFYHCHTVLSSFCVVTGGLLSSGGAATMWGFTHFKTMIGMGFTNNIHLNGTLQHWTVATGPLSFTLTLGSFNILLIGAIEQIRPTALQISKCIFITWNSISVYLKYLETITIIYMIA